MTKSGFRVRDWARAGLEMHYSGTVKDRKWGRVRRTNVPPDWSSPYSTTKPQAFSSGFFGPLSAPQMSADAGSTSGGEGKGKAPPEAKKVLCNH
jgi:hypothetical protein